ncbi:MAG: tRNA (adenosine(37)-N6)-threonylcarbamoyltransferase complex dimerization subunit type 1 TsaB [Bacteroidales bacterium]|nr:tRNA (adenosine(37)-N6)-threonylcarbamoyltransferase complex dimerization subunit type 1 TsaB [Bacteroidales bacterium]
MSRMLLIETATSVCSVVLAEEGRVVARCESDAPNAHSTQLPLFVKEMLSQGRPDAVCVSAGPGSYTGLRIGVSTAKGLCYALDVPLLSVPTLQGMASLYYSRHADYQGLVCPMIDARRMECYTMMVGRDGVLRPTQADVIEEHLYDEWLDKGEVTFIGDGAEKTRDLLGRHPNARYDAGFRIGAEGMLPLAIGKLERGEVEDVAYFEPFYLKDFVAKKSVVHGLRDS